MKFGYFDEESKEYVINRPDTPAPWANYLGSPEYGAIISNNAGGYSFVKSGAHGRITRYIFNNEDKPGRYVYLRDDDDGDYWSASWQPVAKPLGEGDDSYQSACHHGTAYTKIKAQYSNIHSEVLYYVPLNKSHEVWKVTVKNTSDRPRNISVFGYVEFTNESNYEQDMVNLQYTLFITKTYFKGNRILQTINENEGKNSEGTNHRERYFGLAGASVESYNGCKRSFLGSYRGYGNPIAVERGCCDNILNYNQNACGALHTKITLMPGESREFAFLLGQKNDKASGKVMEGYADLKVIDKEMNELINYWHGKLSNFQVRTPSDTFNTMINTWNAYQCFITFIWSRAASLIYCGLRNGYGFRDTVQDIQGIIHMDSKEAKEKLRLMFSAQVDNGGGLPLVKFDHRAGHEDTPDDESYVRATGHPAYRADDALWLFPTVYKYLAETGDRDFLTEVIPYANRDEGTVYDHLKRAIGFSMERLSSHNMPAGLHADWNDCLRLGKKGESTFVAFQLYYAMSIIRNFAQDMKDKDYLDYIDHVQKELKDTLNSNCWDEDRFIRGFKEDGQVIGSRKDPEASMWLNPQSWSVISGMADKQQAEKAMESVHRELNTGYGARVMAPSYANHAFKGALAILFNPSTKENGSIFSQTQGWLILAEALMGHGNRAFEYFTETCPASQNEYAEVRVLEPYAHGQFVESVDSPFEGRANVHWLTGTASTVMVGCVEGILGIRPDMGGLHIAPSIPSDWKEFSVEKNFRNRKLLIKVRNDAGAESGYKEMYLNGIKLESNYIPEEKLKDTNDILLIM